GHHVHREAGQGGDGRADPVEGHVVALQAEHLQARYQGTGRVAHSSSSGAWGYGESVYRLPSFYRFSPTEITSPSGSAYWATLAPKTSFGSWRQGTWFSTIRLWNASRSGTASPGRH